MSESNHFSTLTKDTQAEQLRMEARLKTLETTYTSAIQKHNQAQTVSEYLDAAKLFSKLNGYKNSADLQDKCYASAYHVACSEKERMLYAYAASDFELLGAYLDSAELAKDCNKLATELNARKNRRILLIAASVVLSAALIAALFFAITTILIPNRNYGQAVAMMDAGEYIAAIDAFTELNGYKDSKDKIRQCEIAIKEGHYNTALAMLANGQFDDAIETFKNLNGFKDSSDQILNAQYAKAVALKESKEYTAAIALFKELNGYNGSKDQIEACEIAIKDAQYADALDLMTEGEYIAAKEAFIALNGYKDSAKQAKSCEIAFQEETYDAADKLMNAAQYRDAIALFEESNGYQDSAEKIDECYIHLLGEEVYEQIQAISVGDTYLFGNYYVSNEWLVLAKDGVKLFLLSRDSIASSGISDSVVELSGYTWADSELRRWLNSDYYSKAFSSKDKAKIMYTTIQDHEKEITDKVFLLSKDEANRYLKSESDWYGKYNYLAKPSTWRNGDDTTWWLRSSNSDNGFASFDYVNSTQNNHSIYDTGSLDFISHGVRPALWIDLSL